MHQLAELLMFPAIAFSKMLKLPPEPMATKEMVRQKFDEVKVLQCPVERSLADAFNSL